MRETLLEGTDRGVSGENIIRRAFFFFQGKILSGSKARSRGRRSIKRRDGVIRRGRFHEMSRKGFSV